MLHSVVNQECNCGEAAGACNEPKIRDWRRIKIGISALDPGHHIYPMRRACMIIRD
jgi:hypothetical protein